MVRDRLQIPPLGTSNRHPPRSERVAVVGGGVIGLALAWRFAEAGQNVTLFDAGYTDMSGSWAAAGMLAAAVESADERPSFQKFSRWCAGLWPAFAQEIEDRSGVDVGHRAKGTLQLGTESAPLAKPRLGDVVQGARLRGLEPMLGPSVTEGVLHDADHSVDSRSLLRALRIICKGLGVEIAGNTLVERLVVAQNRVRGVIVQGSEVPFERVCIAAGAWSGGLLESAGLSPLPIFPIKGQMLCLQMDPNAPSVQHVLWGEGIYMVPRADGRLIIGATMEEAGFDVTVTTEAIATLRLRAQDLVPSIANLPVAETWAGLRAGSPDRAPFIGPYGADGLLIAAGHHRNGILQAPGTAEVLAAFVRTGTMPEIARTFDPGRLDEADVPV